jgi:lipopolysaccharide export system permease protein
MFRTWIINKYLAEEFLKIIITISIIFFCLGIVMNIFEEINFFKDIDIGLYTPVSLSLLYVPSLIYNMFPFIILLSGIWFFLKIKKNDEIIALKVSGISNFSIIMVPSILSFIVGIFFILLINPITSTFVKKYETIRGNYETQKHEYLATINVNGIWIKEKSFDKNFIIRSSNLEGNNLINLTIYEFDNNNNFIRRIESASADISSKKWNVQNPTITNNNGEVLKENYKVFVYKSLYDLQMIKSLYSNLDTISFWNLNNEIRLLENRGYSTNGMRTMLHRAFAFPFFLLSMLLLSGVFTLGMQFKENNWSYVFVSIIASVLIFYLNDFSAALGKTEKLPVEISVWVPIIAIFTFSAVGLIHANQK